MQAPSVFIVLVPCSYQRDKLTDRNRTNVQFIGNSPSFRMAIIKTMKGEKSNFQMRAMNMKPNCKRNEKHTEFSIGMTEENRIVKCANRV